MHFFFLMTTSCGNVKSFYDAWLQTLESFLQMARIFLSLNTITFIIFSIH